MKILTATLAFLFLCGCSDSGQADRQTSEEMIERYNKPIDAAGAAADQVRQLRDAEKEK